MIFDFSVIPKLFFSPRLLPLSAPDTNMDPELLKGLHQIKECLNQGIFTQEEFDEQKKKLMELYPVTRSAPLTTGVHQSPVSQPLKGVSDPKK